MAIFILHRCIDIALILIAGRFKCELVLLKCELTQREEMDRKPAELIITAVLIFF